MSRPGPGLITTTSSPGGSGRGVRWSPASDVAAFWLWLHSNGHDMDPDQHKHSDTHTNDKRRASQQSAATSSLQAAAGTEPDNKYYEVEAILDGPRKRREHLVSARALLVLLWHLVVCVVHLRVLNSHLHITPHPSTNAP